MEPVYGFRPRQVCIYYDRCGGRRCTLGSTPAIRRSIWSGLLSSPSRTAGHVCIPELLCFYLFGGVEQAGIRAKLPFYLGHTVVCQPHYALVVLAPTPRHQIEVAICASGNFWLGPRGRIPRLLGH